MFTVVSITAITGVREMSVRHLRFWLQLMRGQNKRAKPLMQPPIWRCPLPALIHVWKPAARPSFQKVQPPLTSMVSQKNKTRSIWLLALLYSPGSASYPSGLFFCQRQESMHIISKSRCASQPSSCFALAGSA